MVCPRFFFGGAGLNKKKKRERDETLAHSVRVQPSKSRYRVVCLLLVGKMCRETAAPAQALLVAQDPGLPVPTGTFLVGGADKCDLDVVVGR